MSFSISFQTLNCIKNPNGSSLFQLFICDINFCLQLISNLPWALLSSFWNFLNIYGSLVWVVVSISTQFAQNVYLFTYGDSRFSFAPLEKSRRPKTNDGKLSSNLHVDTARKVFNWKLLYIKCELRSDDRAAMEASACCDENGKLFLVDRTATAAVHGEFSKPDFPSRVQFSSKTFNFTDKRLEWT